MTRHTAISKPFLARKLMHKRRVIVIILLIFLAAVLYNVVRFYEWEFNPGLNRVHLIDPSPNNISRPCHKSVASCPEVSGLFGSDPANFLPKQRLFKNKAYMIGYGLIGYIATQFLVPFIFFATLNIRIVLINRRAAANRAKISHRCSMSSLTRGQGACSLVTEIRETKMSLMMFIIITKFFICRSIPCILNLLKVIDEDIFMDPSTQYYFFVLLHCGNLLAIANLGSNAIVYYFFNSRYNALWRHIFLRKQLDLTSGLFSTTFNGVASGAMSIALLAGKRSHPGAIRRASSAEKLNGTISPCLYRVPRRSRENDMHTQETQALMLQHKRDQFAAQGRAATLEVFVMDKSIVPK